MSRSAWSFVHYTCGHSTPSRRGGSDVQAPRPCPDCQQHEYHENAWNHPECSICRPRCYNPVCPFTHPHTAYSRAVDDTR